MTGIREEARSLAQELETLPAPRARFGAVHYGEIAHTADILLAQADRNGAVDTLSNGLDQIHSQILIHRSGARQVLEDIIDRARINLGETIGSSLLAAIVLLTAMAVLAVFAFYLLYIRLGRPLEAIQAGLQSMVPGQKSDPIALDSADELGDVARAFNSIAREREQHEASLRESEQRFRQVAESVREVFWIAERGANRLVYLSPAFEEIWLRSPEPFIRRPALALKTVHPEDRQQVRQLMKKPPPWQNAAPFRIHRPCGDVRWISCSLFAGHGPAGGRVIGVARDVTEQMEIQQRLEESQRLEAVGQLTGGVAHDFNNLLTVILGNAELISQELDRDSSLKPLAGMLETAAHRGSELTARLLAFARRQPLSPRRVDLNQLIEGMDKLMRRTLGEQVELQVALASDLWPVRVDPAQMESALLNLCLNARDAMSPGGGQLTIESGNVRLDRDYTDSQAGVSPGQYVMVTVSDTGCGIAERDLEHVFEPFFTTKKAGHGSGLGLSMVYGFIKQSEGHIKIYSEPGAGTAVRLYLPRDRGEPEPAESVPTEVKVSGGEETLLMVEDNELVRDFAQRQLESLGYHVLVADTAARALEILRKRRDIDLLFTDVIMPGGMDGWELAEAAQELQPDLKVLYTSGYTENALIRHGRLQPGVRLVSKPYRRADLARQLRDALDAQR